MPYQGNYVDQAVVVNANNRVDLLSRQLEQLLLLRGGAIASAAALPIPSSGNYFAVSGTTSITSLRSMPAGTFVSLQFQGALLLTHNATTLILLDAVNHLTAAGCVHEFVSEGAGNWREVSRRDATSRIKFGAMARSTATALFTSPTIGAPGSSILWTGNRIYATPLVVDRTITVDRIGLEVTTIGSAGSIIRLGIYRALANGLPGALVIDAGTIAGDALGFGTITISQQLEPGRYYLGSTQPTVVLQTVVRAIAPAATILGSDFGVVTANDAPSAGLFNDGAGGLLVDPWGAPGGLISSVPAVYLRLSA